MTEGTISNKSLKTILRPALDDILFSKPEHRKKVSSTKYRPWYQMKTKAARIYEGFTDMVDK